VGGFRPIHVRNEGVLRTHAASVEPVATFGRPRNVTASELAIETFLPADDATRRWSAEADA